MKYLRIINLLIAIVTVISGLVQAISPSFVLNFVGAQVTPSTCHFFAIIGMFMFLFGGMMIHALYAAENNNAAVLWASLQKAGASAAVFIGIFHHIFTPVAALVASFDFLSFFLLFAYYRLISK